MKMEYVGPPKSRPNQPSIKWAHPPARLGNGANDAQRQGTSLLTIEVAYNGHRHRHNRAAANGLDKAGGDQPDQAGRGSIDAETIQKAEIRKLPKCWSKAAKDGADAKNAQAEQ